MDVFPSDIFSEILWYASELNFLFRLLNREFSRAKFLLDHTDVFIALGYTVEISDYNIIWYKNGLIHMDYGLPAIIYVHGEKRWYQHGKMHRENLPAVIRPDGGFSWYRHGVLHCSRPCHDKGEDLPADVWEDGSKYWFKYGKCHRDDDLPAVMQADGRLEWWKYGKLHRKNNLPAVIHPDGSVEYWVNGRKV